MTTKALSQELDDLRNTLPKAKGGGMSFQTVMFQPIQRTAGWQSHNMIPLMIFHGGSYLMFSDRLTKLVKKQLEHDSPASPRCYNGQPFIQFVLTAIAGAARQSSTRPIKAWKWPHNWWMRRSRCDHLSDLDSFWRLSLQVANFNQVERSLRGMLDNQRSSELYLIQHCSEQEIQARFKTLAVPPIYMKQLREYKVPCVCLTGHAKPSGCRHR